jgi:aryl-alcohol dehydrogenase-like predicted oxidoreductase
MEKRTFGRTGFEVTAVGLGAWPLGVDRMSYGKVEEETALATIAAYIDAGGNFIDTARNYGNSERVLGDYFRAHGGREDVFIATKSSNRDPEGVKAELATSLELLGTDYVDVYFLHSPPDDADEMRRLLDVYEGFKREGRIRAIGASIRGPNVTQETVDLCRQYIREGRTDTLMIIYSIFRQKNAAIFEEAAQNGVALLARTVLESGFLTGKYAPGHTFGGTDHRKRWGGEHLEHILEEARYLAETFVAPPYESLAQVATRFVLDQKLESGEPAIANLTLGAKSPAQVAQNVQAGELPPLPDDVMARLKARYAGKGEAFNTGT